jgi:GTPase SAR1 family protein
VELSTSRGQPDVALPLFVVGNAGVGKSTLINTLLNDRLAILPQGGLGPFTAGAARVVYDPEPYFRITCRGSEVLRATISDLTLGEGARLNEGLQRARLLVEGTQFGNAGADYLAQALSAATDGRLYERAEEEDRGRLSVLADLMSSKTRVLFRQAGDDLPAFLLDLQVHCAGFLAPLTEDVEIGWSSEFLSAGLQLVDLPGVGVANDSYRGASAQAMQMAKAVLLVVSRAGLSRDAADLLRPLLCRLLDGDSTSKLVVAVTQIDLVANDAWNAEHDDVRQPWLVHFDRTATAMLGLVRSQLREELGRLEDTRGTRGLSADEVLSEVDVRPVAPVEHRRLFRRSPKDPPHLTSADDTRVEGLRQLLGSLARNRRAEVATLLDMALDQAATMYAPGTPHRGAIDHARSSLAHAAGATSGE